MQSIQYLSIQWMSKMMSKKNAVYLLFCFFVLCTIRPSRGQMHTRLCTFLSGKASSQRLKLCGKSKTKLEAIVRMKRDVSNSTPQINQTNIAPTSMPVATTKRSLDSHTCKNQATSPNGFSPDGEGLDLTVKCYKDQDWWAAIVSWKIPKPKPGRADVVGYVVKWEESNWNILGSTYCDYITNKNVTSYYMDSSKGWTNPKYGGDGGLWITVFPLPLTSNDSWVSFSPYWPSECAVAEDTTVISSFQSIIPSTTKSASREEAPKSTPTPPPTGSKVSLAKTGRNSNSKGPVVNKLVFAVVISVIAVVIVVITLAVIYRKRCKQVREGGFVKKLRGPPHYISYDLDNKTEAKNIARWLNGKNINVVIDIFSVIKSNPRAWSEEQLSAAERIIIIMTPRYLEIISFHQSKKERKLGDELAYNEISVIKNNLTEKPLASVKYVVILHGTKQKDLPHWMSQLKCYEYKSGKLDDAILSNLKPSKVSEQV